MLPRLCTGLVSVLGPAVESNCVQKDVKLSIDLSNGTGYGLIYIRNPETGGNDRVVFKAASEKSCNCGWRVSHRE